MITIYKNRKDIPRHMEYVELNDLFFNQNTVAQLDEQAKEIVRRLDQSKLISKYKIISKFSRVVLDVDRLSTGCKTVLNVLYYPNKVFCLKECGNNALEVLYRLEHGRVYSDYAIIPFEMGKVMVCSDGIEKEIDDYELLKEWWGNEE